MSEITAQQRQIEDVRSVKYITGAMRDISAVQLKGLREQFERNRAFYVELRELYETIWRIRRRQGVPDAEATTSRGALYVAYTTNRHFYGTLNNTVMRDFLKATGSKDTCLVIGDTGKQIWTNEMVKRKNVTFLSFDEDAPSSSEVSKFLQRAQDYARVFVFYPSFVSVFQQTVAQADISFRPSNEGESGNADTAGNREDFLLEPELQEMITFFDTQVRFVLFEQILLETQLAQVAARLVKMDTADQNADRLIINEQRELRRVVSSYSSKRMLETVIGYLQWNTQKI